MNDNPFKSIFVNFNLDKQLTAIIVSVIDKTKWFSPLFFFPHLGWMRNIGLGILLLLFSFGETAYHYNQAQSGLVPLWVLMFIGMCCKFGVAIFLMKVIIPKYLPQQAYVRFCGYTALSILVAILLQHGFEFVTNQFFGIPFWRLADKSYMGFYLLDLTVQFVQWLFALLGISMGNVYHYWYNESAIKQEKQRIRLQMDAEMLKEQVAPALLCQTLHLSGKLARHDPEQASLRLLLLCRLLRYQLYDCQREEVLLDSELKFMNDYLTLVKQNGGCIDFSISVSGSTLGVFVPPLLFISFVNDLQGELRVLFNICDDLLTFSVAETISGDTNRFISTGSILSEVQQHRVNQRLMHLYDENYTLQMDLNCVLLEIPL